MVDRRAGEIDVPGLRVGADETVEVAGLELVGVGGQSLQVGDAVAAGPGCERVVHGQCGQHREAAGAAAPDDQTLGVDVAPVGQEPGRGHAVLHVGQAPGAVQGPAVAPPVAGGAPVVDVDYGYASRGPVDDSQLELATGCRGGAPVGGDQQRRPIAGRAVAGWIGGWEVQGVGDL